ncbi:MAG TPA: hypothetical protein VMZ69_07250 [Saprospiraceae bacterium]|nr:hypothetical protein [Saprospiraceae bacterium]
MNRIKSFSDAELKIRRRVRAYILFFIIATVISGITTFPLETELAFFVDHLSGVPSFLRDWFVRAYEGFKETNARHPFISYGIDWLAWAHLVIAVLFIGPLKDPVRNIWVIQWGIICCLLVFPLALIAGHIREVPLYWRLIDCAFGAFGLIPLFLCLHDIRKLETLENQRT